MDFGMSLCYQQFTLADRSRLHHLVERKGSAQRDGMSSGKNQFAELCLAASVDTVAVVAAGAR